MSETTYTVTGMTCEHCVASVTEEISELDGITAVAVDLPTGAVTVTSTIPVDEADIRAAVTEAGYRLAAVYRPRLDSTTAHRGTAVPIKDWI